MDKATFKAIVEAIVSGFEDPDFQAKFAAARAQGDVAAMMALPGEIQTQAFARSGLEAASAVGAFKEAGRSFGADSDVAPLLARMKAAL